MPLDSARRRDALRAQAGAAGAAPRAGGASTRARVLARLSRGARPSTSRATGARLHQDLRELRASAPAAASTAASARRPRALVLERKARRRGGGRAARATRARRWTASPLALAAHDPERTLERGYALVEDADGRAGDRPPARPRAAGDVCAALRRRRVSGRPVEDDEHDATLTDLRDRLRAASRRSSAGSTPARPACARRWSSAARAAASSSSAPASSTPSSQGLEELRLDELVARLEAGSRPGAPAAQAA